MPSPHGRDLEATRKRLLEWLPRRMPDARELDVSALHGPGTTGFSNDTLLFDLSWQQDGDAWQKKLVVRIAPTGFRVFPHYDIPRQFRIQRKLWRTDVPVARMLWLEQDASVLGAPFYVMEQVEGRIPTDNPPYHAGGWMSEIAPEQRASIWWSGLEVLTRIHRLDSKAPRFRFLREPEGSGSPLERQLDQYERYLAWAARGRPQPTCDAALAWLRRHQPRSEEPVALCWGDARIGNMIFRDGRCTAVLDWEMTTLANPEQDLAWWIFMDHHHSAGVGAPRLPGMPDREQTLDRYQELCGRKVRHLAYYEAFAAFRFSVIMIRIAQQLSHYGLLPEDSDFETNNIPTRLLAQMLDLPAPGAG